MRLPKRGERGFTLIELLIVVAILGVLAAVVIPNVGQFIGAGEEEARETEFANIQTAVVAMMVDNKIPTLENWVDGTTNVATNDMHIFPDISVCATDKMSGPDGAGGTADYTLNSDGNGYVLFEHDLYADAKTVDLVNYVATQTTTAYYTVDANGTVSQWKDDAMTEY